MRVSKSFTLLEVLKRSKCQPSGRFLPHWASLKHVLCCLLRDSLLCRRAIRFFCIFSVEQIEHCLWLWHGDSLFHYCAYSYIRCFEFRCDAITKRINLYAASAGKQKSERCECFSLENPLENEWARHLMRWKGMHSIHYFQHRCQTHTQSHARKKNRWLALNMQLFMWMVWCTYVA